ncbi:hypothetical protein PG984_012938 [Apiospora sp. TS-2023a]
MQVAAIFATITSLATGVSASPLETRQTPHFPNGTALINTYSQPGCRSLLSEKVKITDDCRALDEEGIASIKLLSSEGSGVFWYRKLPPPTQGDWLFNKSDFS